MLKSKFESILVYLYYYYVLAKSYIITKVNLVKSKFFTVIKMYEITKEVQRKNIIHLYYLYKVINELKVYVNKMKHYPRVYVNLNKVVNIILDRINTRHYITKIETTNGKVIRNLIFVNKNMEYIYEKINNTNFDINELMLNKNTIVKGITLVDEEKEHNEIRNLIENYSDRSKIYPCHTLRNILKLKNINHDNGNLVIEQISIPEGKVIRVHPLDEVLDLHISELYNL
jgi:hypothetical protein